MTDLLCAQPDGSKHEGMLSHGCKNQTTKAIYQNLSFG
jgi:hypothetical protein